MQSLRIPGNKFSVLLALAPPRDCNFPLKRMLVEDPVGYAERDLRVIAEAKTRTGQRIRLVSAGRGRLWDYRVYLKAEKGWVLRRLEAASRYYPDARERNTGWCDVFLAFAGEAGLAQPGADLLKAFSRWLPKRHNFS